MSGRKARLARFCIFAILTATIAAMAVRDATTNAYARTAPDFALRFDARNARALATRFDAVLMMANDPKPLTDGDLVAIRNALRVDPIQPALVRLLGVGAELGGKPGQAQALVELASRISRRDVLSQLWMIEQAVQRGSVDEALAHYDIAFTTSEALQPVLFDVLTNALAEPDVRKAVAPYLAARRPWRRAFLVYASAHGKPAEIAATLTTARIVGDPQLQDIQTDLLSRFVAAGDVPGAQQHALRMPGASPARFANAGFTADTIAPVFQPLAWTLSNSAEVESSLDDDNRLQIRVAPGARGVAATRVMHLPAGTYDFVQRVAFASAMPAFARWEWHCIGPKPGRIWENDIPVRSGTATYRTKATVPAACNGVQMILSLTGIEGQDYSGMTVEHVETVLASARSGEPAAGETIRD